MDSLLRTGRGGDIPRPGEVVCGKYRIESVVGAGGMGVVLGAIDTSLNRPVAIKFLSPDRAARDGAVARFIREARAAAAIQSEHVVRVFDVSTHPNGAPFIVMEHLRGTDLTQLLASRGVLTIEEACDYILQACEALGEAHGRGIVHRDLKPQNLFLTQRPDGSSSIKVLDFGISKAIEEDGQNLTATDTVMGTPLYMSPEQVRSLKNVDARADIWALGSILFELLTMAPIFQAPSASALCAMIAMDPPTPLRALRPQAPVELEAVILRCLHKDPSGRFQDVAALADALAPFASERGRLSATRVSAVVRGGGVAAGGPHGTAPAPFGSAPTAIAQAHASYPPVGTPPGGLGMGMHPTSGTTGTGSSPMMFAPSISNHPPGQHPQAGFGPSQPPQPHGSLPPHQQHPTTQSTWQQTQSGTHTAGAGAKRGTSGVVIAMLGVLTGLLLLGLIGGAAYAYVTRREAAAVAAAAAASAAAAADGGAGPGAVATNAPGAPTGATTSNPTSTSGKTGPGPTPTNPKVTDAGAPTPTPQAKDAGAAPPGPNPDKDKEEAERNAALGKQAEANCKNHNMNMTTFARDDASRKQAAERAKLFTCNKGPTASRCEREVCMRACMTLNDQGCIQRTQYLIDHGPQPKY